VRDGAVGVTKGKVAWIGRAADVPAGEGGKVLTGPGRSAHPHRFGEEGLVDFDVPSEGGMRWDLEGRGGRRRRAEIRGPHEMVGHLVRNAAEALMGTAEIPPKLTRTLKTARIAPSFGVSQNGGTVCGDRVRLRRIAPPLYA
jgi:hypothetical protein